MRLKALPLMCLLLLATTQTNWAQSRTESSLTSGSEYGIDLNRSYTGSEVEALLQIVTEESEQAIDRAFNEGYKQGLLASAPDAEYWKAKAMQSESEIKRLKRERWIFAVGGFGVGFIVGGGFGFSIRLQN